MAASSSAEQTQLHDMEEEEEEGMEEREMESDEENRMRGENSDEEEDDSSDDEKENEAEIQRLEEQLSINAFDYNCHVDLIKLLKQEGELLRLRKARQKMSELFPLTEEIWLEWLKDEIRLTEEEPNREKVYELFEKAVTDYICPDIWLEFAQYSIGGMGLPGGMEKVRSIFERAVMAVGLHMTKGQAVWEAYREFENVILSTVQPPPGRVPSCEEQGCLNVQLERIHTLFRRQLAVPLMDMEATFAEYEEWSEQEVAETVMIQYRKALQQLAKCKPLEEALILAEPPKMAEYQAFIDFELKEGDPARIQIIYERALAENCLVPDMWTKYTTYLELRKKGYTAEKVLTILAADSGEGVLPVDSASDDEDLQPGMDPDSSDSDYEMSSSESDEDYVPKKAASSKIRPSTRTPQPRLRNSTRRASVPPPQPSSSSSVSKSPKETQNKRKTKASCKSAKPQKRGRGESSSPGMTGEEPGWHNGEEKDQRPEPLRFMPARVPGPTFDTTSAWSPLSLFRLFFSASVVHTLIENTNANALKRFQDGNKYVWKVLTVRDFYIFLTVVIFTGLVHVPHRSDYWSKKSPYDFPFPADKMSRERFEAILWSLHMSNPEEDEENERKKNTDEYDRLFKIKPLYTDIVTACKTHFQPFQNISIDERMVASKALLSTKHYKPRKWGYKLCVLLDSSTAYTWNFIVQMRKSMLTTGQGLGYSSVMDLMPLPLLGGGYALFVENFYTSPALFEDLSTQNIGCCGTIGTNQIGFPQNELNDLPKKAERGDLRWIRKGKLLFVKWMDRFEVSMCSTVHEAFSGQTVKRKVKEAGVSQAKTVPIPDAVVDHNQNMGVRDVSDALIAHYNVHNKKMKWYKAFFYRFMDISLMNSFVLHKELYKMRNYPSSMKPHTQKSFREQLAAEMLEFAEGSAATPSPPPLACMPMYYGEDGTQSRKYCRKCYDSGILRVKTPVFCIKCQVPLCLTSKRNCYQEWHDQLF
ncbi:squamous cell carcinoma antigen recognized by T-cells 3 isoform X1 [Pseudochaenichthys georgianus]|uniref:squamous cell carcinoma antigen recognized by T-cells 3 isoform X1 n=1 Tax=Pseudochaenichthys georgianus TaxID=52239 RepID=UPI00146F7149|nr:squamous cell carcinoma antigen recognized by T-cells 3 isoform X1 [Pseudochaenichthys georgianus]